MSNLTILGDTSGSVVLQAPAVAGSTTLTLPATSMTVFAPEVDQWRVTSDSSGFTTEVDLTANINRYEKVGTGMTQSSGIFTFPSTGYWLISAVLRFQANGAATVYTYCRYNFSTNSGSSWSSGPTPITNMYTNGVYASCTASHLLQVTNASTYRYKFSVGSNTSAIVLGTGVEIQTQFLFQKVAA